mgnify:FL=1
MVLTVTKEARTERGKFNPKHFEITTLEGLVDDQFLVMQKAMEIICVDESYIRILLKHCNWNVERLLHKFLEEGQEKLFAQAGIHLSDKPATKLEAQECSICFGDIDPETVCGSCCLINLTSTQGLRSFLWPCFLQRLLEGLSYPED